MTASRQSGAARTVPTDRLTAQRHLVLIRTICLTEGPFSKHDLQAATAVPAERAALVMRFACATGLAFRAPGRGMYQASDLAMSIGPQWRRGDQAGRAALGRLWKDSWFGTAARARLTAGPEPRLRVALAAHLLTRAHLDERSLGCAEVLVDLLIATGLIALTAPGYITWADGAGERRPGPGAVLPAQQTHPDPAHQTAPTDREHPNDPAGTDIARPGLTWGTAETETAHQEGDAAAAAPTVTADGDLVGLLSRTWQFADLVRLTEKEVISLHRSLHGLIHAAHRLAGREAAPERPD